MTQNQPSMRYVKKVLRFLFELILLFVIIEILIGLCFNLPNAYFTGTPNSKFVWPVQDSELNGIDENAVVEFDKYGTRSSSEIENKTPLLVFGGSTAACTALSQEDIWSDKLEKKLGQSYWIGNVARDGVNSFHNVIQAKHLFVKEEFKKVKYAIYLVGINDFLSFIGSPESYLNETNKSLYKRSFAHLPNEKESFLRTLNTFKVLQKIKRRYFLHTNSKRIKQHFKEQTTTRKKANKINQLPDLKLGLGAFQDNVSSLIQVSRDNDVIPIFIQQTSLWGYGESDEDSPSIVFGAKQFTDDYFSSNALAEGLEIYNSALKEKCANSGVLFIPLSIPQSFEYYYDDMHYNRMGTDLVSDSIYHYLKKNNI